MIFQAVAIICFGLLYLLVWDFVFPRWFYDYKRKKHMCGAIDKSLGWPFGLVNAYRYYKLTKECKLLGVFSPPTSLKTRLNQVNTFFVIETANPANIKALLSTQVNDFNLSYRHLALSPLLGNGIFTSEGQSWRNQRAMLRPIFARERVSNMQMLESHFQSLFNKIKALNGGYSDMQKTFFDFTLGTSLHFLFDFDFDCFSPNVPLVPTTKGAVPATELFNALERVNKFLNIRKMLVRVPWLASSRQFKADLDLIHSFADAIVDRVLRDKENDCFIAQAAKVSTDRNFLRDQALTMFLAGRSTTASFLSHLVLDLSRFPSKYEKLRESVLRDIGSDASDITFEKLKRCSYLVSCLNESLRLHPNVPINVRAAVRDTTLPSGGGPDGSQPVFVPKGTQVQYNVYGLQRDPKLWGEDADKFRPERWEDHKTEAWTYLPFNGGPRTCLGQQFALNEAGYVMARLVQEFQAVEPGEIIKNKEYLFSLSLTIRVSPSVDVRWTS